MRHRRWVVVLAVLIIAVLPLSFIGLRIASRHPSVKRAVLSRIVPRTEGRLAVGELDIGLASLRLGDVTVEVGEVAVIRVPEASVSVSYKRLLTNGFKLRRALSTVIVKDPEVTITYGGGASGDSTERAIDLEALVDLLPSYLGVSGGTLVLEDAAARRSVRIDSIALLLEKVEGDPIKGSAVGGGFGAARNVRSDLVWNGDLGTVEIAVDLTDADFEQGLRLPAALPVDAVAGRASAALALSVGDIGIGRVSLTYSVEDGRVVLPGEIGVLERASIVGSYDGSRVVFAVDAAQWHGADVRANGAIDVRERSFDALAVAGSAVPLDRLAEAVGAGPTGISGLVDFAAVIEGPVDAPALTASARAGSLEVAGVGFSDLRAEGAYSGDLVELTRFTARALGGTFEGSGHATIGRGSAPWVLDIHCEAEGLAAQAVADLLGGPEARGELALSGVEIAGTSERPEFEALVRWSDVGVGPVDLGTGAGGVFLRDGTLYATAASSDSSYTATAEVARFFSDPFIEADVTLFGLAVDSILDLRESPTIPILLDGGIEVAGPSDSLGLSGSLAARGRVFAATLTLDGNLTGGPEGAVLRLAVDSDDATVRGVDIPFSSSMEIGRSELVVSSFDIAGVARGRLRMGLGPDHPLEGSLVISEAELDDVLGAATGIAIPEADGLVFASGSVTGTLERPVATLQLQVGSGRLAGVGRLDGALVAALDGRRVAVRELTFREAGRPFVTASGEVELDGDIALTVRGDGIPGPLLGGGRDSEFDLTLGLGGRTDSPTLDGRLESSDGTFLRIPYDEFVARVTGAEGVLRVEPLALERSGSYRLSASARVPYGAITGRAGAEGSLSVEVDGDPLALLAELTPLVERARGSGHLEFHLAGDRRGVTLVSGDLQARASRVEPSILFDELRDVEVGVTVSDGAVREGSIRAVVDGSAIAVRSARDAVPGDREPEPLSIGGVDVGILAVSTDGDGVRTTVPGLMLPEDVGRVAVRGKDGAPELLVSGPAERPFLWGDLEFSDMTFTYPFADSDADVVGGFLSDAEWSARITAGRNVWYWRPDANLRLETGGSLDFAGVPSDGGLCVSGRIESSKGSVRYLDTDFDVREVFVDFPPFCEPPRFYVEASTRVEDGTTVTLTMDAFEPTLAFTAQGATIDESALTLTSDSPGENTQEEIVSKLSYGVSYDLLGEEEEALGRRRAIEVIGTQIGGRVVRPLLSPIEGRLKRNLNLDLVRFEVDFVEHFLAQLDQWSAQEDGGEYQPFLADTRVTLGKYVSRDWLLSYVGIAEAFEADIGRQQLGLLHELGIEYEVSRNTSLSLRAVYDPSLAGWDRRISIENRYEF